MNAKGTMGTNLITAVDRLLKLVNQIVQHEMCSMYILLLWQRN